MLQKPRRLVGVGLAAGLLTTLLMPATAASAEPFQTDSKGGYKECPAGQKVSVHLTYAISAMSASKNGKVTVRIYETPSRSMPKDRTRTFSGYTTHDDVNVKGRIQVGYWSARSAPGKYIVSSSTYATCMR